MSLGKESNQKKLKRQQIQATFKKTIQGKDSTTLSKKKDKKKQMIDHEQDELLLADDMKDAQEGLVIERLGDRLLVMSTAADQQGKLHVCLQRSTLASAHIVPGDQVYFRLDMASSSSANGTDVTAMVCKVKPRMNVLQRPAIGSSMHKMLLKNIAANIDILCVIVAARPLVPLHTIDNYITYAELMQIPKVMIIVNKADLPDTTELYDALQHYKKSPLNYEIIATSVPEKQGISELLEKIKSKTTIFVGQSGVGKSSLIRCLLPNKEDEIRVGDLVKNDQYGAHTTSNARIYQLQLPDDTSNVDTYIIDSPGIRELSVAQFEPSTIIDGFVEVIEAAQNCKFRNCNHFLQDVRSVEMLLENEQAVSQCGVIRGIAKGEVNIERYESLKHLISQSLEQRSH